MTALYPAPLILDEGEEVLFHNVYAIVPEESVIGGFWSFVRLLDTFAALPARLRTPAGMQEFYTKDAHTAAADVEADAILTAEAQRFGSCTLQRFS